MAKPPVFYKVTTHLGGKPKRTERPLPAPDPALRTRVADAVEKMCIARKDKMDGTMVSRSGQITLNWLVDFRPLFLNPDTLSDVCKLCWEKIAQHPAFAHGTFQIAGMETAAIPLLIGLLAEGKRLGRDVSGLIIRKERKDHGKGNLIEGDIRPDAPVLLVDDILNSGESAEKSRAVLAQVGLPISLALVVLDFQSRRGKQWRTQNNISTESLFTLDDFKLDIGSSTPAPRHHAYHPLWRFRAPGADAGYQNPKSTPLLLDDVLYFGADNGKFYAIDAANGAEKWSLQITGTARRKGIWSSPCFYDGKIFFGAYNGNVYALDMRNGGIVWEQALCEWVGSSPIVVPRHNSLIIGLEYERPQDQGSMVALDLNTGEKKWEHWLRVYQHGSAVYDEKNDFVIFGTNDHDCRAVRADTGELVWRDETKRSIKYPPALIPHKGWVTATSFDGNIYVWDCATGQRIAAFQTDNICYTTPLVLGNKLYAGSGDRKFYVIDLDELKVLHSFETGARVFCNPRVVGHGPDARIIFGNGRGNVYEMHPETFDITDKFNVPDAVCNAIISSTDGTRIYVPTYMNEIYAFQRISSI